MKVVYPGSFDPLTNGHIDIINRCNNKFDKIVVAVLENQLKKTLFTVEERVDLLNKVFSNNDNIEVVSFSGLLVDFCKNNSIDIIIRGIRAVQDYEFELQLSLLNNALYEDVETFFLTANSKYSFVSSTFIKDIASYSGDVSNFVPKIVEQALINKYKGE